MGENDLKEFPNYFPDSCPPIDKAIKEEMKVYRIVPSSSIKAKDFIAPGVRRKQYASATCDNLALSVLSSTNDIPVAHKFFSGIGMKKMNKVAVGHISPDTGVFVHDPSQTVGYSHVNWWTFMGVEPHTYFNEILKIGEDI
ncbi:hypothetical protein [Paenibacillus urinalis]|uniref:Uncharacterized protein n=1 Tax=Paenibacillus urinalis TaxID=521520 RepID=A0AAX3MYD1_9BACL|nr:hypothetical protein [Paenibacillus urinalis]WDH82645.1 hypothetical protein PUW23_24920 [Paenibacillus urinalis]WDI00656.1 hypothetical protein PUW25_15340 [Paenibacillus urinalis]